MTHIENIKCGDWIAILNVPEDQDANPFEGIGFFFGGTTKKRPNYSVTGKPLKVLAICHPFVSVSDGTVRFPIDSRHCSFTKLDKKYVETLTQSRSEGRETFAIPETNNIHRKKKKKEKPGVGFCPRCGEKLIERLTTSNLGVWMWVCKRCGFMGGGPDQNGKPTE